MSNPILVLIDIQREYTTPGRPFYLNGIDSSLENCNEILTLARDKDWTIVHIKHLKAGSPIFNPESEHSDFATGFEPSAGETIITKDLYSCYSAEEFRRLMETTDAEHIYIIGYNSIMCCLSTVIDGYHRGNTLTFIEDASLAKATAEFDEADMHKHSISIIKTARYANVITTDDLKLQHQLNIRACAR